MKGTSTDQSQPPGRSAKRPWRIPLRGWLEVLLRVQRALSEDNIDVVAAGVAFYAMLAVFPGLAALIAIYGLFADPADVQAHLSMFSGLLAPDAWAILDSQLTDLASADKAGLSLAAVFGLFFALWSASRGVKSLMIALNIVYGERETRGIIRFNALALGLALGAILSVILWVVLMLAVPVVLRWIGLVELARDILNFLRWPLLVVLFLAMLSVLYRVGPDRRSARWPWVSLGAVAAVAVWLLASLVFALYVAHFSSYNETYGAIGAIVVLLLWFYISAYIVLLGAELNASLEHRVEIDTTVGAVRPPGSRGAYVADTLSEGRSPTKPRWMKRRRWRREQ